MCIWEERSCKAGGHLTATAVAGAKE